MQTIHQFNAITEKAGISTDQAKQMLPFAQESLQEGLMSQVTGGNLDGVLGMFKSFGGGGLESNSLFGSIKGMFMKKTVLTTVVLASFCGTHNLHAHPKNPYQPVSMVSWMKGISDQAHLNQIIMPGSHDAGMSQTEHCSFGVVSAEAQTQDRAIYQQAIAGSRYFDIRVDYDHDTLTTYHRTDSMGCGGEYLKDVLNDAVLFLQQNPSETLIIKFSHTRNDSGHYPSDITQRVIQLLTTPFYQQYLYTTNAAQPNLDAIPLSQLRGKIIAVFDQEYSTYFNPQKGIFSYRDFNPSHSDMKQNLSVYDSYADTSNFDKMSTDQLNKLKQYGGWGQNHLFLLSWTLTGSAGNLNIYSLAEKANTQLDTSLSQALTVDKDPMPNIVYIDFMNPTLAQNIVQCYQ